MHAQHFGVTSALNYFLALHHNNSRLNADCFFAVYTCLIKTAKYSKTQIKSLQTATYHVGPCISLWYVVWHVDVDFLVAAAAAVILHNVAFHYSC
jgi:hypothetical protein